MTWTDGEAASSSMVDRITEGGSNRVYASVRGISSADDTEGCDAIIRLASITGFLAGRVSADIRSGRSERVLYRGPQDGWSYDYLGGHMAEQLRPGGEAYKAIVAEKIADCSAGAPGDAGFCAKLAERAREEKAAIQRAVAAQEARKEAAVREEIPAWRALAAKPPLPESARKYRVLAEDALQEKRFEDAARYYDQALAIQPLWPEGQFNAAILYGELQKYAQAASHMRLYLELVPNAKDAAAARDKIIIWEEKAGRPG